MNVENLSATDPRGKFARLARIVARNLRGPDILAVEEMQDDDGAPAEGDAGAGRTFKRLVAAIRAAGGPRYRFRQIDPRPGADGGEPGGNIRVGFLFRTDRGLRFVDRGRGGATTPTREDRRRRGAQLTLSPGRVQPRNAAFEEQPQAAGGPVPLARADGCSRSRATSTPRAATSRCSGASSRPSAPRRRSGTRRRGRWATSCGACCGPTGGARIVVLGDFNDFEFSRTLAIVRGAA